MSILRTLCKNNVQVVPAPKRVRGFPPPLTILFQNLSLYNINNQSVKFDINDLTAGFISKNEL